MLTRPLPVRVSGTQESRNRGPGHGEPSSLPASFADGLRVNTRKNSRFAAGAKNNAATQVGSPASRNLFTVIAKPSQMKGRAMNNITPANSRFSILNE